MMVVETLSCRWPLGAVIDSAASGIFASNVATDVSSTSSISVTADGTINSGTIAAPDGNPPAGILAGYNSNDAPEADVAGNVTVTADADITATAGDGIRAYNFGTGNITVNDDGGTIKTLGQPILGQTTPTAGFGNGIYAFDDGGGSIVVSTASGVVIDSAASGIFASNAAERCILDEQHFRHSERNHQFWEHRRRRWFARGRDPGRIQL